MKFALLSTILFSALALATPAPKEEDKLIRVVIHYVDAPDCDYQCGANTTSLFTTSKEVEPTTTLTSTSTKYVIVTLQTGYGSTETLGYETATTKPTDAPKPTYH